MESFGKESMNCEQVEAIVLDLDRDGTLDLDERAAVLAHVGHCSRCASLQESWQSAREELRALAEDTMEAMAPSRVEMRLRQEFRTRHRTMTIHRAGIVAAWAMAAAALVIGVLGWRNWEQSQHVDLAKQVSATPSNPATADPAKLPSNSSDTLSAGLLNVDDLGDFTPLPDASPEVNEQAEILRVRMQRGSLGALGLPVNEQRAGDWIQVDVLVGTDGLPEAVRLAQEEN